MPEFILDHGSAETAKQFAALDSFTQGYIEAMFFTDEERLCEGWRALSMDCALFQTANAALLDEAYGRDYDAEQAGRDFWYTRNGHGVGFWDREELKLDSAEYEALTAEMVAAGYDSAAWNAALAKRKVIQADSLGERLSTAARAFHSVDSYVGDDGKVYLA